MNDCLNTIEVHHLGSKDYTTTWQAMKLYTKNRDDRCFDQFWLVQHPSVYTQGQAGKPEHLLAKTDIPLVQSDRGGQITYHGPGQVVLYCLVNLRRKKLSTRDLVCALEKSIINCLDRYQINSTTLDKAPGVYVKIANNDSNVSNGQTVKPSPVSDPPMTPQAIAMQGFAKIASLGLRVSRGCSYHGLSLNVAMDLTPFQAINPCGYPHLQMAQLSALNHRLTALKNDDLALIKKVERDIVSTLCAQLSYPNIVYKDSFSPTP